LNAKAHILAMVCGLAMTITAVAEEDDPDAELIEFLGSWEGEDEEWQVFFDAVPEDFPEGLSERDMDDRRTKRESD